MEFEEPYKGQSYSRRGKLLGNQFGSDFLRLRLSLMLVVSAVYRSRREDKWMRHVGRLVHMVWLVWMHLDSEVGKLEIQNSGSAEWIVEQVEAYDERRVLAGDLLGASQASVGSALPLPSSFL